MKNMTDKSQTKTNQPRIIRVRTELWVPHNSREIGFASPAFGSNAYIDVGKEILSKGLNLPTGDYTASLLHPAYCNNQVKNEQEFKDVRNIMKNNWLWVFNRNLWNKNGVYVVQDLDAIETSQALDINELEKRLKSGNEIQGIRFSEDNKIRFAPKNTYKLGEHTSESFAKDGFIIASCGQEGAEKYREVSDQLENNPYIYGVETETPEQRVSAVDESGSRLGFYGDDFGVNGRCLAFGVLK